MTYYDRNHNIIDSNDSDQDVYNCDGRYIGYLQDGVFYDKNGNPY